MTYSQGALIKKFNLYLKNRGREDFAANLSPGYCQAFVRLFCYFAKIKKLDKFYQLLKNADQWDDVDDQRLLEKINKIKTTTEWQEAHKKFETIESQLVKNQQQTYSEKINEAKKENLITHQEAKILLSALLPDDPAIEKILALSETLQRIKNYEPNFSSSSGSGLELIRDIDKSSSLFTQPYKEDPEFEDAIIILKENLHDLLSKLPENRSIVFGTGRHAFGLIREKDTFTAYDSNSAEIIPDFNNPKDLAKYFLENIYVNNSGSHVPVSIEILAQENQDPIDYNDLKQFCNLYRKNENSDCIKTNSKSLYPIDGVTPLILSLIANLPRTAFTLIEGKIGLNTADALGFFPIHYAALNGLTDLVKKLIENGVDINQCVIKAGEQLDEVSLSLHDALRNATPLFFACVSNHIETVKLLLDSGADINKPSVSGITPLMVAIIQGHYELFNFLISRGAKIDSCIHSLSETQYQKKGVQLLTPLEYFGAIYLPEYEGFNIAMIAAKKNQPQIVLKLLKAGIDINYSNKHGVNLLQICVMNGIVNQEILNFKPDVNSLVKLTPGSDKLISPLWIACYKNSPNTVKLLLEKGANPNIKNENELSPLEEAVTKGSIEIVELLINRGADVKIKSEGQTLLDIAIKNERFHLVEFLLSKGVVPQEGDEFTRGTLALAVQYSRLKESQLDSISHILTWMIRNNREIPENLSSTGNDGLLIEFYKNIDQLSSADRLCMSLIYMLIKFTNPFSSQSFTMYSMDNNNPTFLKLSDRLKELTPPTFDAIKALIQQTLLDKKLDGYEIKFLQALDRLNDDCKRKAHIEIKEEHIKPMDIDPGA